MESSPELIELDTPCEFFDLERERESEKDRLEWEKAFFLLHPNEFYQQYKKLCETMDYKEAANKIVYAIFQLERGSE